MFRDQTTGQPADAAVDSLKRVITTPSGNANSYANITTSTTTLVKSGAGALGKVIINKKGTVASAVKVYDGVDAGGTLIASIDSLNLSGTFDFQVDFAVGLCIVTTGTAAPDVTATYS